MRDIGYPSNEMDVERIQKVHCIGIGGIGLSALARFFLEAGKTVTGSDMTSSVITDVLEDLGVQVHIGNHPETITEDIDLVVYTVAVSEDNPELVAARELNIPVMTYPEALGEISKDKFTIAIAGTHGKTTTTGMLSQILIENGKDPSVVIGSFLKGYKSNFVAGKSDILLAESCEYKRSFLHMHPNILVITNVEEEHLDYYADLADIQNAFIDLVKKVPEDGYLVCDVKHPNVLPIVKEAFCNIVDYNMEKLFFELQVPGEHNIQNARVAVAVADLLEIPRKDVTESLLRFSGTWRRSEHLGRTKRSADVYDDYGHHPEEIKTTLKGFRDRFKDKKIVVVFQPHLYSRTKVFFDDFVNSFKDVDEVIVTPIYAAREAFDDSINNEMLAKAIAKTGKKAWHMNEFYEIENLLNTEYGYEDLVITMGAGNIYEIAEKITNQ